MPISSAMARQMVVRGYATLVAALPRYPTPWPMKIWSTMLYRELTSMARMLGTAKERSSLGSG